MLINRVSLKEITDALNPSLLDDVAIGPTGGIMLAGLAALHFQCSCHDNSTPLPPSTSGRRPDGHAHHHLQMAEELQMQPPDIVVRCGDTDTALSLM
jgi:hypothetical protein